MNQQDKIMLSVMKYNFKWKYTPQVGDIVVLNFMSREVSPIYKIIEAENDFVNVQLFDYRFVDNGTIYLGQKISLFAKL